MCSARDTHSLVVSPARVMQACCSRLAREVLQINTVSDITATGLIHPLSPALESWSPRDQQQQENNRQKMSRYGVHNNLAVAAPCGLLSQFQLATTTINTADTMVLLQDCRTK
ncbi:hypothetical protein PoB_007099400 [Plakobranchus ocellatus]|uniref:Uncharacterized protein n=1 Tax=Plakobranchus ocellatus TaxID=259542 RepID=A0AAV4DKE0_9GAST|nr:hypothetical protein PoB_007099400 [Plakobranchus ocellatus]